jgi:hypothetical protein
MDEEEEAAMERKALVSSSSQVVRLRDVVVEGKSIRTLGFHLEPKVRWSDENVRSLPDDPICFWGFLL